MSYSFDWNYVSGGAPYVTISSLGLSFNSVSVSKLGTPEKVIVGFDEANRIIGVKAYDDKDDSTAYEFSNRIRAGWVRIGCRDFVKQLQRLLNVDFTSAKRFVAIFDSEQRILIIDAKSEFECVRKETGKDEKHD
jgi:hypothetical protein